jgi:hypothetical protein
MQHHNGWLALGVVAAIGGLAGCAVAHTAPDGAGVPAIVEPIQGTSLHRLILTAQAVGRLGIQTTPVRQVTAAAGGETVVPVSAVLYDSEGQTWTYTNPQTRTYVRQRVVVGRIDNGQWVLRSGPAPGTSVVTVGAAELLGTEDGVDGAGQ